MSADDPRLAALHRVYIAALVSDVPAARFRSIKYTDLPASIRSESEEWLSQILKPEVLPHRSPSLTTRYYLTGTRRRHDLLEFRWKAFDSELRLVQSINAIKVDIPLPRGSQQERTDRAKDMVSRLFRFERQAYAGPAGHVELNWPAELKTGAMFSSNNKQVIQVQSVWSERVDAFVDEDLLSIIFFKRSPSLVGSRNGSRWLAGPFSTDPHTKKLVQEAQPSKGNHRHHLLRDRDSSISSTCEPRLWIRSLTEARGELLTMEGH